MDLSTNYLQFDLEHPIVPSSSPLTGELDSLKNLEDSGAPMVVLPSLFEEQIEHDSKLSEYFFQLGTDSFPEALSYFPNCEEKLDHGLDDYIELVRQAKNSLNIPVIASLNGVDEGGWLKSAKLIEEAGADALELNMYFVSTDIQLTGAELENRYLSIFKTVRSTVKFPLVVKLSPFYTSLAHFTKQLEEAGANGLVFFNRFFQPDIDIENLQPFPHLILSDSNDLRLPLRWISLLSGRLKCDLAASSGIHQVEDIVKAIMAGASITHVCSVILNKGPQHIQKLKTELSIWLEDHEYESLAQMLGSMNIANSPNPSAIERANYMKTLYSWKTPNSLD